MNDRGINNWPRAVAAKEKQDNESDAVEQLISFAQLTPTTPPAIYLHLPSLPTNIRTLQ